MKVVVTGAAGFIGSHLADSLLARGDEVVALDDLSAGVREAVPAGATFVEGSVTDAAVVRQALDGAEVVLHHAAAGAVPRSVADPLGTNHSNIAGTLQVLVTARDLGVRRVIVASSSSVYGGLRGDAPAREDEPLQPQSPYAVTKVATEHYARVFTELYGLETVCLRYFNVYGPRQRADGPYAAVVPLFVQALLQGRQPVVYGDGRQSRDFTHVGDVVRANLLVLDAPAAAVNGCVFNVAYGRPTTLLELVDLLSRESEQPFSPSFAEPRPGDIRHSHADVTAARKAFGFRAEVDMEAGLQDVIAWHRAHLGPSS